MVFLSTTCCGLKAPFLKHYAEADCAPIRFIGRECTPALGLYSNFCSRYGPSGVCVGPVIQHRLGDDQACG